LRAAARASAGSVRPGATMTIAKARAVMSVQPAARHHRDPLAWLNQRCSSIVKGLTFCVAAAPDPMRGAMDLAHMGARL
jgi:hypothetical protein